ncbi:hypothetical protein EB077_12150, partial [bacterium]|nr:hypothetical protein [bacterium]
TTFNIKNYNAGGGGRALMQTTTGRLVINAGGDFNDGVEVQSKLQVGGNVYVNNDVKSQYMFVGSGQHKISGDNDYLLFNDGRLGVNKSGNAKAFVTNWTLEADANNL